MIKTKREIELEDLLTSARAIAERKGEDVAWERFSERLKNAGIGWVTPKTFRILPSDTEIMKCEICNRQTNNDLISLYRINETGVKGIWRCWDHLTLEQRKNISPEISEIVSVIEEDNERKNVC